MKNSIYNYETHWNKAYKNNPNEKLGWFESDPVTSLELIEKCELEKESIIFNAGAGTSNLIKLLISKGYKNIIINDISSLALEKLKNSIEKKSCVKFIRDDLTKPKKLLELKNVALWHDRAVLHFFVEKPKQLTYFNLLKKVVKKGGFVILSEFNLNGAKKCCGLNIFNYNKDMLKERLGDDFLLLEHFDYTYKHPNNGNTREYIYTLFQRKR